MQLINSRMFRCLALCCLAALLLVTCHSSLAIGTTEKEQGTSDKGQMTPSGKPRLAVLLVFDQMRGDYLTRWENLYTDKGFRRLMREGAWVENCHYPYAHSV